MSIENNSGYGMFDFFEKTPVLVCIAGKDGYFRKINLAVINKLGYTEAELFASPISSFVYHEDQEVTSRERAQLLLGKQLLNFQNRYVTKKGSLIWLEWTSIYFPDKEVVFAIANDITDKKKLEKEIEEKYLKFKGLATHFKTTIEEDRKNLAFELHEELAQMASVVKMNIDFVNDHVSDLPFTLKSRLEHAIGAAGLLINTIRRISFSISPHMLEEHGLNETLEWQCKEFTILNGIPCKFEASYDQACLTYEMKLDFFRICQEALRNVMYHAQASQVNIRITEHDDRVCLTVEDDGKGFNPAQKIQTTGLTSMRERAASINGQLNIRSDPGKGTSVSVEVSKLHNK